MNFKKHLFIDTDINDQNPLDQFKKHWVPLSVSQLKSKYKKNKIEEYSKTDISNKAFQLSISPRFKNLTEKASSKLKFIMPNQKELKSPVISKAIDIMAVSGELKTSFIKVDEPTTAEELKFFISNKMEKYKNEDKSHEQKAFQNFISSNKNDDLSNRLKQISKQILPGIELSTEEKNRIKQSIKSNHGIQKFDDTKKASSKSIYETSKTRKKSW